MAVRSSTATRPETTSLALSLASLPESERARLIARLTDEEAESLLHDWKFWARPSQLEPEGDWTTWLILAGRGFGKTRTGAEWVRAQVEGKTPLERGKAQRIALVAETAADARDILVEGESGILSVSPRGWRPHYEPSKRRLTWPNGAVATLYNAVEPDQLRGPQHDLAWSDELAKWRYARETWDQLQLGLRLGERPRQLISTTPRPIPVLKEIVSDPDTVVTRGSSYDNIANLAPAFVKRIIKRYEGTRLGRQELQAELLEDVPGALWSRALIDSLRVSEAPDLKRVVIAIDPAATSGEDSDETGLLACGLGIDNHGYVLADHSGRYSPDSWARKAIALLREHEGDRIVAEVNNGGDMVGYTLKTIDPRIPFKAVRASRGKVIRAEPVAALYEQGKVHHVGSLPELEDQMCAFTTDFDKATAGFSPDRLDALVWGFTELMLGSYGEPRITVL